MRSFCTYEDRPEALIGMKLLILSLEKFCRDFTLYLGFVKESPGLAAWLRRHAPHVVPVQLPPFHKGASCKHIKPLLLLHLLEQGIHDVTWLDADIIVLRDLEPLFTSLDQETLLVAQEMDFPFMHSTVHVKHFGMRPNRRLKHAINTCVVRVTPRHRALLEKFHECLLDELFVEQQARPRPERIPGFELEQSIFEMLLTCDAENWTCDKPVDFIPEGRGIIQELGVTTYAVGHRLTNGLGWTRPWMAHALGHQKPWNADLRDRRHRSASVYSALAKDYRDKVEEEMAWINNSGFSSRIARALSFGQPHWVGWGYCLAGKTKRFLITGSTRRKRSWLNG